jgi:N-acetylmuramoyl-L-alanine amidase
MPMSFMIQMIRPFNRFPVAFMAVVLASFPDAGWSASTAAEKENTPVAEEKDEPGRRSFLGRLFRRDDNNAPISTSEDKNGEEPAVDEAPKAEDSKPQDVTSSAKKSTTTSNVPSTREEAPAPLPTSGDGGWQLVKVNGRDYVTAESIHRFYRFSTFKVDGKHVWLRSNTLILKGQIGSQELLINNVKFILSYPVIESAGRPIVSRLDLCKLIDPVLRPSYISDGELFDTVVLDAGHGGHDVGARGVYGYEKDYALKMVLAVKKQLEQRGFKVVLTRSKDVFITLSGRVAIANQTPRSIFVSIHFNSGGSDASGIETFALTPQGSSATFSRGGGFNAYGLTGNEHDSANIALATAVHAMVVSRFKFVDRGIKRAQWSVLTGCKKPGILFEGGFVTNGPECRLIASDNYRESVGGAMADAVVNYKKALESAARRRLGRR